MINGTVVPSVTEYIVHGSFAPQSVVDILQSLKYHNVKDEPTLYTRTVEITVSVHAHLVILGIAITVNTCSVACSCT